jgi:repressor LexA
MLNQRIKYYRKQNGYTQEELAKILREKYALGTDRVMVSKWETGFQEPQMHTVACLADLFGVSLDDLNDDNTNKQGLHTLNILGAMPIPRMVKKPRLGAIACGEPILAEENIESYDDVPNDIKCDFTLICKGDSMINARINDGDVVYIKAQEEVNNGEIAACLIDGEFDCEATLKRYYKYDDKIMLQAENPNYPPFMFTKEEMNKVRIIGKAVGFISRL